MGECYYKLEWIVGHFGILTKPRNQSLPDDLLGQPCFVSPEEPSEARFWRKCSAVVTRLRVDWKSAVPPSVHEIIIYTRIVIAGLEDMSIAHCGKGDISAL